MTEFWYGFLAGGSLGLAIGALVGAFWLARAEP